MNRYQDSVLLFLEAFETVDMADSVDLPPVLKADFMQEYEAYCERHQFETVSLSNPKVVKKMKKRFGCSVKAVEGAGVVGYEQLKSKQLKSMSSKQQNGLVKLFSLSQSLFFRHFKTQNRIEKLTSEI